MRLPSRLLLSALIAVAPLLAAPLGPLDAQQAFARLRGVLIDAGTKQPVRGARVVIAATGRYVTTDSLGRFDVPDIPSGIIRFFFTAQGYPRTQVVLAFAPGEQMVQSFEVSAVESAEDSASGRRRVQELPTAEVTAAPSRGVRYEDFERRMKTGRGHYVTREQIEASTASNLTDVARGLRGVNVECGGGRGCYIRMARATTGCTPQYIVDGREDNFFGPYVAIRDIEGIEFYTGAADVPGEFAGFNAACGVIVIWTRNGPPQTGTPQKARRNPPDTTATIRP